MHSGAAAAKPSDSPPLVPSTVDECRPGGITYLLSRPRTRVTHGLAVTTMVPSCSCRTNEDHWPMRPPHCKDQLQMLNSNWPAKSELHNMLLPAQPQRVARPPQDAAPTTRWRCSSLQRARCAFQCAFWQAAPQYHVPSQPPHRLPAPPAPQLPHSSRSLPPAAAAAACHLALWSPLLALPLPAG
jgi:hypothetical protein